MSSRRARSKRLTLPAVVVLLVILALVAGVQYCSPSTNSGEFRVVATTVTRVHDGDTFHALVNGKDEKIRLIGVDTPEVNAESESERAAAQIATEYAVATVEGKKVWLVIEEVGERDRYDRLLAYVWLSEPPNTETEMRERILEDTLNGQLITTGNAVPLSIKPNTTFADIFERAAR